MNHLDDDLNIPSGPARLPLSGAQDPFLRRLLHAEATVVGQFGDASNATLLVALTGDDGVMPTLDRTGGLAALNPHAFAVYKPERGEAPLWDFPDRTLWRREIAACVVDRALGLGMVPTTVGRDDLEHGVGSLQRLVVHDPDDHYFSLREDESLHAQLRLMVVLDLLLDNADRKAGHVLLERDGADQAVRLIDHGVCFHPVPHLRTVAWDFGGEVMRDDERVLGVTLARMLEDGDPSVGALHDLLLPDEVEALSERAHRVARMRAFPTPEHDRQYPWPLL
jgi:uncharacterized repeat protein (TIGR03843 family)